MCSDIYIITVSVNSPNLITNYILKFRSNSGQKCSPEPEFRSIYDDNIKQITLPPIVMNMTLLFNVYSHDSDLNERFNFLWIIIHLHKSIVDLMAYLLLQAMSLVLSTLGAVYK